MTDTVIVFWKELWYTGGSKEEMHEPAEQRFCMVSATIDSERGFYMELNIAATIRNLRREMGITQEEFANDIGVTAQAVSKWERGEGYPD